MFQGNRQNITVEAYGEGHAIRTAAMLAGITEDTVDNIVQEKKPRHAKTCTTDNFPANDARKWETQYDIYSYAQRIAMGNDEYRYMQLQVEEEGLRTKTDALKRARELAIERQLPMTIKLVKVLAEGSNSVSDLEPKSSKGRYVVYYYV